jgi:hypothetical protein
MQPSSHNAPRNPAVLIELRAGLQTGPASQELPLPTCDPTLPRRLPELLLCSSFTGVCCRVSSPLSLSASHRLIRCRGHIAAGTGRRDEGTASRSADEPKLAVTSPVSLPGLLNTVPPFLDWAKGHCRR